MSDAAKDKAGRKDKVLQDAMTREEKMSIRSKLFVPGSRPEIFAKAMAGEADALSFDLEDSVVQEKKAEARDAVATFLRADFTGRDKIIVVRVNGQGTSHHESDIASIVACGRADMVNLPKVESAADVLAAVELIEAAEKRAPVTTGHTSVLANIETPRGIRFAYEIACAHPRVVGLQIGFLDLSRACGFSSSNQTALNSVRMSVRLAAAEAGIAAYDGAYADVNNTEGFRRECHEARAFGLTGKSCIHPSQVPLANSVFSPDAASIEAARRIVASAAEASQRGAGAFLLDGRMIDSPVVAQAEAVLAQAARDAAKSEGKK